MRNFLFALVAGLVLVSGVALAGVDAADIPSVNGKGFPAETGVNIATGKSFVGVVVVFEADDTAAYPGPTAATLDTGTEACAVYGMSCADVMTLDEAGASGDELAASACSTDLADDTLALAYCY